MSKPLTDYERYIRTEELLKLQKTENQWCCQDELTFQVIHQISELHFKLIIQYMNRAKKWMEDGKITEAAAMLGRVNMHLKQLPELLKSMEFLEPIDYHSIRLHLGQGSGQDSPGFNRILQDGPGLWAPYEQLLSQRSLTVLELHKQPHQHYDLFHLTQELIGVDQHFQNYRYQHLQLVRRMIGLEAKSLKGIPAKALQTGMRFQFYPELWKAISELTDYTGSSYNPQPLSDD